MRNGLQSVGFSSSLDPEDARVVVHPQTDRRPRSAGAEWRGCVPADCHELTASRQPEHPVPRVTVSE